MPPPAAERNGLRARRLRSACRLVARRGVKDRGDVRREGARDLEPEALRLAPPQRDLGLQQQRARDHADGKRLEIEVERHAGVEQPRRAGAGKLDRALAVRNVDQRMRNTPASAASSAPPSSGALVLGDQQPFVRPEPQRGARAFARRAQRLERRRRAEGGADRRG